jgi:predicted CopG family antitoxin
MKDITISIDEDVYRAASEEAARQRKSLSELVRDFLMRLQTERMQYGAEAIARTESCAEMKSTEDEEFSRRQTELAEFFARLRSVQVKEPESEAAQRAELLLRLQPLMEQALERDRYKEGPLVPLTREEIYAERFDRFR